MSYWLLASEKMFYVGRPKRSEIVAAVLALIAIGAGIGVWVTRQQPSLAWPRWTFIGLSIASTAALVLGALLGPGARWLAGEPRPFTARERRRLSVRERADSVHNARQTLIHALTGLAIIAGAAFTAAGLVYTAKTLETTQQAQITDRYTKAVEQLGSPSRDVRLGAIYALERIATDSSRDYTTIMDVLAAFVREHDPEPNTRLPEEPETDIQAALTVLNRHKRIFPPQRRTDVLDLHGIQVPNVKLDHGDLRAAKLTDANLTGAFLYGANLEDAELVNADLSKAHMRLANLVWANLEDARMMRVNLYGAKMDHARLSKADLRHANLERADLHDAFLEGADMRNLHTCRWTDLALCPEPRSLDLRGAHLAGADLRSANLRGADLRSSERPTDLRNADLRNADLRIANLGNADLRGADLRGADLRKVRGQTPEQIRRAARTDTETKF